MKRFPVILIMVTLFTIPLFSEVLDQIDAIVNGEIILASEIDDQIFLQIPADDFQNKYSPEQRAQIRRQVLQDIISQLLLKQEVKKNVSKEYFAQIQKTVEEITNRQINEFKATYTTAEAMIKNQKGITWDDIYKFRYKINEREYIAARIFPLLIRNTVPKPTQEEIDQFKRDNADKQTGERILVAHILLRVPSDASPEEEARVKQKMSQILNQARSGVSFEELAKMHSQDTNTAQGGGILPEFQKGDLFKEFDVAFELAENEISDPIRTIHGFHIMKVLQKDSLEWTMYQTKLNQAIKERIQQIQKNSKTLIKQNISPTLPGTE
jgi:peptidyl-prolyl cis-trans isomerase SurA